MTKIKTYAKVVVLNKHKNMPERLPQDQSIDPTSPHVATDLQMQVFDADPLQPRKIHSHRRGMAASFLAVAALGMLGKEVVAPALAAGKAGVPETGHVGHEHGDVVTPQKADEQIKTYSMSDFHRLVKAGAKKPAIERSKTSPYGTKNVLTLMQKSDIEGMYGVLTKPENDPTLETLFFQRDSVLYDIVMMTEGNIQTRAISRYRAYLDETTPPELKAKLGESFTAESAFWERQKELSSTVGFEYANPAAAIQGILDAPNPEEALAVMNRELLVKFGTEAKFSDDIATQLVSDLKNTYTWEDVVSSPIDRSPDGTKRLKIAMALIAHGLANTPVDTMPNTSTIYLTHNFQRGSSGAPSRVGADGVLAPQVDIAGMVLEVIDKKPRRQNDAILIYDIGDVIGWGEVDGSDAFVLHEAEHVEDLNGFDKTNAFKVNRARATLEPSVRYKNPSKPKSNIPLQATSFSYSIGWNRYNKRAGVFNPDGTPGPNAFTVYTSPYGTNNNIEDFAESTSDLKTRPQNFIYKLMNRQIGELEPVDLKRLSYLDAQSDMKRWRAPLSGATNQRLRTVVFNAGKGGELPGSMK